MRQKKPGPLILLALPPKGGRLDQYFFSISPPSSENEAALLQKITTLEKQNLLYQVSTLNNLYLNKYSSHLKFTQMKKLILLIVFVGVTLFKSYCQDFPDFGMPSKEEIELKECSFDKTAPAVILIHEAFSYSEDNLQLITTHHVRIKILNQSGVNAANISIPFFRINNFERIINLETLTINEIGRAHV